MGTRTVCYDRDLLYRDFLSKDIDPAAVVPCVIVTRRDESSGARSPENALRMLPV